MTEQTNHFQKTRLLNLEFMAEDKKRNVGTRIAIGASLGLLIGLIYGNKSGNVQQSLALGLAFGTAAGAIFDFVQKGK